MATVLQRSKVEELIMEELEKVGVELDWLRWFYRHADFGPADRDVMDSFKKEYMQETGRPLPSGYEIEAEEETWTPELADETDETTG